MHALRNARAGERGGRGGGLTRTSGYNFPLFLAFPLDMPDNGRMLNLRSIQSAGEHCILLIFILLVCCLVQMVIALEAAGKVVFLLQKRERGRGGGGGGGGETERERGKTKVT